MRPGKIDETKVAMNNCENPECDDHVSSTSRGFAAVEVLSNEGNHNFIGNTSLEGAVKLITEILDSPLKEIHGIALMLRPTAISFPPGRAPFTTKITSTCSPAGRIPRL